LPSCASSQTASAASAIPAELSATDPEIKALLNDENTSCKSVDPSEQVERIQKALQIADKRGLVRDRALVEAVLASALISEGKFEMAFVAFQKALQDSMDIKSEVLEADILLSLASEAQIKGNNQKALDLVSRALTIPTARKTSLRRSSRLTVSGLLLSARGMATQTFTSCRQPAAKRGN
jgi:tetratricopeptide (TPR) repeat protein